MDFNSKDKESPGRPWVVSLQAFLLFFGGLLWVWFFSWYYIERPFGAGSDNLLGTVFYSLPVRVFGILVYLTLTTVAGFGLFRGKKWGWWLSGFFFLCCLFDGFFLISIVVVNFSDKYHGFWDKCSGFKYLTQEPLAHRLGFVFKKHGLRMLIYLGLYAYWFSPRIMNHFGIQLVRPWRVVLIESGICLAYFGLYTAVILM